MAKNAVLFVCNACGAESLKWQGQCPQCSEWNTLESRTVARPAPGRQRAVQAVAQQSVALSDSRGGGGARASTGAGELDRVLGGGLIPGSVTLIGGDPGIGKSTLLLQVAAHCAQATPVLYVSGEESIAQVALRAERLGLAAGSLAILAETDLDAALEAARERAAKIVVIDSIQTVQSAAVDGVIGGVSQLKECTAQLVRFAKTTNTSIVIIGHVTKEGAIAGPRVLEHLVDAVLYFESDLASRFRIVRATKNRFGPVGELAFFHMSEAGLKEVKNPSAIFLSRTTEVAAGSVVTVTRDGQRPLLVEIQGLVDHMRFGSPRRLAQGLDAGRVAMLLAVLSRHAGVGLQEYDVFANVVGGLNIDETGTDLPIVLALASSLRDMPVPRDCVAFGEIGLTGEVRPVAYGEERLREAAKQGFVRAFVARDNMPRKPVEGLEVIGIARVHEALERLFGRAASPGGRG